MSNLYLQWSLKVIDINSNGSVGFRSKFVLFNTDRMFEVCRVGIRREYLFVGTITGQGGGYIYTERSVFFRA